MTQFDDEYHQKLLNINNREKFFERYTNQHKEFLQYDYPLRSLADWKYSDAKAIIFNHIDERGSQTYYPISDMTQQEIYDEAIKLYCEAVSIGNKRAKSNLAEQLLKKDNPYLTYDKVLGEFLMKVGLLEKETGACLYFAQNWHETLNDSVINFWCNLFDEWLGEYDISMLELGIPLDFRYDATNKKVVFYCESLHELED